VAEQSAFTKILNLVASLALEGDKQDLDRANEVISKLAEVLGDLGVILQELEELEQCIGRKCREICSKRDPNLSKSC